MAPSRPLDALYDPVYITSGKQQRATPTMHSDGHSAEGLPRFDILFSDRWKPRQHSGRTKVFGPVAQVMGMHSPAVIIRAAVAQDERVTACKRAAVARVHTHRSTSANLPRRKLAQQRPAAVDTHLDSAGRLERQRLKVAFEAALPPMSDSRGIVLRRKLMEAWETAEWQEREAYIEGVQEHQVKELQHDITRAQQDEENILAQRLRARSAKEGAAAQHASAILDRQHTSSKALLVKDREQLQQRVKGAKGLLMKKLLGPLGGQGVPKARRTGKRPVQHAQSKVEGAAVNELAGLVGADLGAHQPTAGLRDRISRHSQRKDAEYVRHLESAHRALLLRTAQDSNTTIELRMLAMGAAAVNGAHHIGGVTDRPEIKDLEELSRLPAEFVYSWDTQALRVGSAGQSSELQPTARATSDDLARAAAAPLQMPDCSSPEGLHGSSSLPYVPLAVDQVYGIEHAFMQLASPDSIDLDLDRCVPVRHPKQQVQEADIKSLSQHSVEAEKSWHSRDRPTAIAAVPSTPRTTSTIAYISDDEGQQPAAASGINAAVEAVLLDCIAKVCEGDL